MSKAPAAYDNIKKLTASQRTQSAWFHLHLCTTKDSCPAPQLGYIVTTVLCLHKSKEGVLH